MIGKLSSEEIENLLSKQCVGRIGCYDNDVVYVVPISYAYDGCNIYCHTYEGKKMEMMRKNPKVCFQIDDMKDMANWKSVITWGEFEEINDKEEKIKILKILLQRRLPVSSSVTTHLGKTWPFSGEGSNGLNDIPGIVFKICLKEKSGKFESTSIPPLTMYH
ncbi:MAG: pyridoxamine 5'-phosphate oxidase family protein [Chitinophagales bacterium]